MILIIDNYDSFVYNIARYIQELNYTTHVVRNDQITLAEINALAPSHIIISPGPCTPLEAGISNALIAQFGQHIPILGICLGHQCIGHVYGNRIVKARQPQHGKTSRINHNQQGLFQGLSSPLTVTRYHSLIIENCTDPLMITATTASGEIMAVAHRNYPVVGVQFHPEAVLTEHGHQLLANFIAGKYR
jgi:para-aminobenzoate synthetase component 2